MDEFNRPLYGDVFGVLPKISDFQEVRKPLSVDAYNLIIDRLVNPSNVNHGGNWSQKKASI